MEYYLINEMYCVKGQWYSYPAISDANELKIYVCSLFKDDNIHTVWSDRLYQWDPVKYNECRKTIFGNESQYFDNLDPLLLNSFLSQYLGKNVNVVLKEKTIGYNGYPVWAIHYIEIDYYKLLNI